jgi:hypothetical protein
MDLRRILDIITENSGSVKSKFPGVKVTSLQDFYSSHKSGDKTLDEDEKLPDDEDDEDDDGGEAEVKSTGKNSFVSNKDKFLGAQLREPSDEELKGYLGRVVDRDKDKLDKYKMPYVHRSNLIPILYIPTDGEKIVADPNKDDYEFNMDALKKLFTTRPTKILKQNSKMKHSDGSTSVFYNIGLPAIVGLAVDESTNKFMIINTCPGAGVCKTYCFVNAGGYVQYSPPSTHMTRNLNFLLNDPEGWKSMLVSELESLEAIASKKDIRVVIRWHDAGDFFSDAYKNLAFEVAKKFPNILFYAYTKVAAIFKSEHPDNFVFNFSQGALRSQEKQIDFTLTKHSRVVDDSLFKDLVTRIKKPIMDKKTGKQKIVKKTGKPAFKNILQYKGKPEIQELKNRLAKKYNVDPSSILTYQEMIAMGKDSGEKNKWNVIVKSGDGDDAATRRDVLGTYLLIH